MSTPPPHHLRPLPRYRLSWPAYPLEVQRCFLDLLKMLDGELEVTVPLELLLYTKVRQEHHETIRVVETVSDTLKEEVAVCLAHLRGPFLGLSWLR